MSKPTNKEVTLADFTNQELLNAIADWLDFKDYNCTAKCLRDGKFIEWVNWRLNK